MNETKTTSTLPVTAPPVKKAAIVGTAGTWKLCPFQDPDLHIYGLNDLYVLGMSLQNFKGWFDLHPLHQMVFRAGRTVSEADFQPGQYLRPQGHLDWLRTRPFPVFLQQAQPTWPNSREFPREQIQAKFGKYFSSTPAWMLAWLIQEGYDEIHVYGIHLATQWEYMRQRPNFEWLLGVAMGKGVRVVVPERASILKDHFIYAYEQKPEVPVDHVRRRLHQTKVFGKRLNDIKAQLPWYARGRKAGIQQELAVLEAELTDARIEMDRLQLLQQIG
jgi:hypothetical protein